MNTTTNTHQCPECDHEPYATAKGLSSHRRYEHGIVGSSKSTLAAKAIAKKLSRAKQTYPCPQCDFISTSPSGRTKHFNAKHQPAKSTKRGTQLAKIAEAIPVSSNGHAHHAEETHTPSRDPLEIPLAITLGRFTEICRTVASEHGLPERMFAARFAELVYRTQIRHARGNPL